MSYLVEEMISQDIDREERYRISVMREIETLNSIGKALDRLSRHYRPMEMNGAIRRIVSWIVSWYPDAFETPKKPGGEGSR